VVYVQVNTGNGDEQAIHTVESRTGEVLASAILADPMTLLTGAVDRDGHVLGFGYDASAGGEQVYRIDPSTGARTTLGAPILDFDSWSGSSSLDVERDRLYAVHTAAASGVVVRTIDAATGADLGGEVVTLDGSPALSLDGLQVNPAGELLGIVQGGSIIADAGLHLVKVEPSTGVATLLGSIDDVLGWSGDTVYNPTTDVFVVFGLALDSAMHLWMLDGATGAVVHDTPLATAASSTLLVY
jgi:hypothetical protein